MMWNGNRRNEQFTFVRVTWDGWREVGNYNYIKDGNIELACDSELKITGSFSFEGLEVPNTKDLLRVYYKFDGIEPIPLGTFFATVSDISYVETTKGMKASGTIECQSVLAVLNQKLIGRPKAYQKCSAVYEAVKLMKECNLNVDYSDASYQLNDTHLFDAGTSYLEMVNWLVEAAGCRIFPDANGTIVVRKLTEQADTITFANNSESIMYPDVENSKSDAPNVVRLLYNNESTCIEAWAKNVSGSRASIEETGRERTLYESVSELTGGLDALKRMAEKRLIEESSDVETVTFSHAYIPMNIYDNVQVRYGDISFDGIADDIAIALSPAIKTQTKVKSVKGYNLTIETGGAVYRDNAE